MTLIAFASALRPYGATPHISTHHEVWRVEARIGRRVVAQAEDLQVEEAAKKVLQRLSDPGRP